MSLLLSSINTQALPCRTPLRLVHIDPDTQLVAYLSDDNDNAAKLYNLSSLTTARLPFGTGLTSLQVQSGTVVSTSFDGACNISRFDLTKLKISKALSFRRRSKLPTFVSSCSLSSDAALLAVVFVEKNIRKSWCSVYQQHATHLHTWCYPSYISSVVFSPDGQYTFLFVGRDGNLGPRIIARHTRRGIRIATLRIDCQRETIWPRISSDRTAQNVAVTDRTSLRIWNIHQPEMPVTFLPSYNPDTTKPSYVGPCAISPCGARVVAAVSDNSFGIWDVNSQMRIGTLVGHGALPIVCAISSCGSSVFAVAHDNKVCQWSLPQEDTNASAMEQALMKALDNPEILDDAFLRQSICADNIKSASDLLAGHNIVLLAIRCGVITRDNIHTLGGSSWYLRDNLYLPASKLTHGNAMILDAIFHHADDLGIITDGYVFKVAREIRTDLSQRMRGVGEVVTNLAERVIHAEHRIASLEYDSTVLNRNVSMIHSMVGNLFVNQQMIETAVVALSDALKHLKKSIEKGNKRMFAACVAKCVLSFIPLVGKAIGEVAYTATEIIMNLNAEDLVPFGVDAAQAALTQLAHVDLSNFQTATYLFSEKGLYNLEPVARRAVRSCIEGSGFRDVDELSSSLRQEISTCASERYSIALLDIGSSLWMTCRTASSEREKLNEKAREYFHYLTGSTAGAELSIGEAKIELNNLLKRCEDVEEIGSDEIEELFFRIAHEHAEAVDERVFMEMFRCVCVEQFARREMDEMIEEFGSRFDERARPSGVLSVKMARRLMDNVKRDVGERGWAVDSGGGSVAWSTQHSHVDRDEFLSSVRTMFGRFDDSQFP